MKNPLIIICLLLTGSLLSAQTIEKDVLKDFFKPPEKTSYIKYLKSNSNELEVTFTVLFLGYKSFFSSQDIESCVFHPSCSEYAVQCMQHHSILVSPFQIMDRLQRCHPFATPKQYNFNIVTGRFYDPIDN